jgi:hypothetical protein
MKGHGCCSEWPCPQPVHPVASKSSIFSVDVFSLHSPRSLLASLRRLPQQTLHFWKTSVPPFWALRRKDSNGFSNLHRMHSFFVAPFGYLLMAIRNSYTYLYLLDAQLDKGRGSPCLFYRAIHIGWWNDLVEQPEQPDTNGRLKWLRTSIMVRRGFAWTPATSYRETRSHGLQPLKTPQSFQCGERSDS